MKANSKGFTLIELVVVIIILGILGAVALPRLMNLQGDARAAVMRGVHGSMQATNAMIYAKANLLGAAGATGALSAAQLGITFNTFPGSGGGPLVLVRGYASNAVQLARAMEVNATANGDVTVSAGAIAHKGAAVATGCQVGYTPATAASPPLYTITTITGPNAGIACR